MKKKCLPLAMICWVLGFFLLSCQNDNEVVFKITENVDPNLSIAKKNLDDFIKFIEPNTKSTENEMNIIGVVKKNLPLELKDSLVLLQTRSTLVEIQDSAYLYIFTIKKGENKGYAIVSGEERVPKLYAYVEKGDIADTVINGGLAQALRMIDEIYSDDVLRAYVDAPEKQILTRGANKDYTKSLTKMEWGQYGPYNRYVTLSCPNSPDGSGKAPAGCVPIALSMVITYLQPMFAVQEDQINKINTFPYLYNNNSEATELGAKLIKKVGSLCEVNYGCGSSSATLENASMVLSHYWVIHQLENGLNDNWTKNCLNNGYPIIASGSTSSVGHCWLIDGGIKDSSGKYIQFYNNWGQHGIDNGYFAVTDFCRYTNSSGNVESYTKNNRFIYIFDVAK